MTKWRIVETDNFGGDYPDESFVGPPFQSQAVAQKIADLINGEFAHDSHKPRYWKVVEGDYKLQPGFEP